MVDHQQITAAAVLPNHNASINLYKTHYYTLWLSGRKLDSRPRGRGFEPHRRHYVVSLSKTPCVIHVNPSLVLVQPRKIRPCITERLLSRILTTQICLLSIFAKKKFSRKFPSQQKSHIIVCEQLKCRPACASAQSCRRFCYSLILELQFKNMLPILASLCS